jgi:hypothetical protein
MFVLSAACCACSSAPSTASTSASSSSGAGDADKPLDPPDVKDPCLPNGGQFCTIDPACGFVFRCRLDDSGNPFCDPFHPDAGPLKPPR